MCYICSIVENMVYVTTPPVNETTRLPIKLLTVDGSIVDTNRSFEFYRNPVFTDIRPRSHLTA